MRGNPSSQPMLAFGFGDPQLCGSNRELAEDHCRADLTMLSLCNICTWCLVTTAYYYGLIISLRQTRSLTVST